MQTWLWEWFGEGPRLSALQMSCRAAVCFFLLLGMIRLSGRRSFGQHMPFDACVTVLLGAILSRTIVGASPFLETAAACFSIALLHRVVAMLSARFAFVDRLMNGAPRMLVYKGGKDQKQMRLALVSDADLLQALRLNANTERFDGIEKATLERNGNISILREPDR